MPPTKARNGTPFDCLEYKRRVQARIHRELKGLSPTEEIAYYEQGAATGPLGSWWKELKKLGAAKARGAKRCA